MNELPATMDGELSHSRWLRLMGEWGLPPGEDTFAALQRAYGEEHRHYHTGAHINSCLALLDLYQGLAANLRVVEMALWFHDAVYDPRSSENEVKSAAWAAEFLQLHGGSEEETRAVTRAILATSHSGGVLEGDDALVVDIDLCTLGSDDSTYAAFEDAIRAEYLWVPPDVFRARRAEILEGFITRPAIYHHPVVRAHRESRARENLGATIAQLRGKR